MKEQNTDMSFLDHLEELRGRIIKAVLAIFIGAIVLFIYKDFVFDTIIFGPKKVDFFTFVQLCKLSKWLGIGDALCVTSINYTIINTTMLGKFTAHIIVSLIGGFIIAFPIVFQQLWSFIKPGLKKNEVKAVRGVVWYASLLFFAGVSFGYFLIAPLSLQFLGNYELGEVESKITIMSYMKTVASITLAAGLIFQLPVVVYFLSKVGIVTPTLLRKFRRHALVAVLIISAIITPPDITSQVMVSLPVLLLYEVSILISKRVFNQREKSMS